MTIILDGKALASKITENLKNEISQLSKKPKLAVILIGNDPASQIYVKNKNIKAQNIGFESLVISLPENSTEENILEHIYILNEDKNINGILVQLPLPEHINKQKILEAIDPIKDVDGFTSYNYGRLALGYKPYALACTPKGVMRILKEYNIEVEGKNVLIIGRSNIVGKPLSIMLQQKNATVTVAHSKTKDIKTIAKQSDIVISAIGKPKFVNKDFIKKDAIVIDVGISRTMDGICGDVDFENIKNLCSYITPVPGGVGPMTIAMLMENTFELYKYQLDLI
ncbi:bifunctional methylenetetrahydrofolate dehydrogenase/methenyltetrahydrofolate cyclohydrolase FolD [bacterium]|nr:bifunctional methylenetetrahydrofolate dehydrogenase/methenyltetrahydrofolate cyclohydrolase FolD [bacterium]